MITKEQYEQALNQQKECDEIIRQFHKEERIRLDARLEKGIPFTDEELVYSEYNLCPCGHGLAYFKGMGLDGYWDCSAILKAIEDKKIEHTAKLPFMYYEIKSEQRGLGTTRGIYKPKGKL